MREDISAVERRVGDSTGMQTLSMIQPNGIVYVHTFATRDENVLRKGRPVETTGFTPVVASVST
jgi:hypothetical protein